MDGQTDMEKVMQRYFKTRSITVEWMVSPAGEEMCFILCMARAPCSNAGFTGMSTVERAVSSDTTQ
jgi:hypothetical protein